MLASAQTKPEIELTGLKDNYVASEKVQFSIHNSSKRTIDYAVAIEADFGNQWLDVVASLDDPERPFAKVVKITSLRALQTRLVEIDLAVLVQKSESELKKPISNRLRLAVRYLDHSSTPKWTLKSRWKTVISQPFTITRPRF